VYSQPTPPSTLLENGLNGAPLSAVGSANVCCESYIEMLAKRWNHGSIFGRIPTDVGTSVMGGANPQMEQLVSTWGERLNENAVVRFAYPATASIGTSLGQTDRGRLSLIH
jgi:hypothetical protein